MRIYFMRPEEMLSPDILLPKRLFLMNRAGPIVIIEDDTDDQYLFTEVFNELNYPNEILFFDDGITALTYLLATPIEPFLIISDINMPKLNGIELREKIHNNEDLKLKCIPYLFFTSVVEQRYVIDAYSSSIQGFFIKPNTHPELKCSMKIIIDYWLHCVSPNYIFTEPS